MAKGELDAIKVQDGSQVASMEQPGGHVEQNCSQCRVRQIVQQARRHQQQTEYDDGRHDGGEL